MSNWSCSHNVPITSTLPSQTPEKSLASSSLYYPIRQIQLSAAHHPFWAFRSKPSWGPFTGFTPVYPCQAGAGEPQTEGDTAGLALQSQIKGRKHSSTVNRASMRLAALKFSSVTTTLCSSSLTKPSNKWWRKADLHSLHGLSNLWWSHKFISVEERVCSWFQQTTVLISLHINTQTPKNLSVWASWIM